MSIPAELEAIPHWVAWRWEIVGDRRTKVPYNPKTGNKAASTRPSTWGTFEEAQAARMDGIGFVVTPDDPYCGVDIDHCLRAGQLLPVAKRIVDTLDSYTEVTPSGDGVRVWVKAQLTRPGRTKAIGDGVKLELYDSGRYFTVTGRAGRVSEIRDRQAELDEIHREFFPDRPVQAGPFRGAALTMSDWELLNRARAATNGANFERLWRGDTSGHGDDDSVADCALLCHLAFWTNRDAEQMDRLFRQSGLYREKWERQDYRANTIAAALARTSDGYSGAASHADANTRPVAQEVATDAAGADDERATPPTVDGLIELSDISDAIDEYYRHGAKPGEHPGWDSLAHLYRIQRGQWTLVTGQPTHGKTTWLDALLVNLIDKLGWRFVICSPENQPLEQHFAQLAERVVGAPFFDIPGFPPRMSWEELQFAKAFLGQYVSFALSDHPTIDAILAVARHKIETQGLDGLVIDPWNTIEHSRPKGLSESEYVGVALDHFRRFARRYGIHLWLVAHPTKLQKERRYDEQNKPVIKDGRVFMDYPIATPYDVSGCYSDDTEVLTRRGWRLHGDLSLIDEVACFDIETGAVRYEYPQQIIRRPYRGQMLRFKGYGYDLLVTPDHRMVVKPVWKEPVGTKARTGIGRAVRFVKDKWQFCEAGELPDSSFVLPLAGRFEEPQYQEAISADQAAFAGWFVSEGCFQSSGVSISQAIGEKADAIEALLTRMHVVFKKRINPPGGNGGSLKYVTFYVGVRANRDMVEWTRRNCGEGAARKRIPDDVFKAHQSIKEAFLMAYLDGDGTRRSSDTYSATTVSRQLKDDLQQLCAELGRSCCWVVRTPRKASHSIAWILQIGSRDRMATALRGPRNRSCQEYDGLTWCLTVPTGAYFVRRNGRMTICGNSANWFNMADNAVTVWRDDLGEENRVQVHVTKIRFRHNGRKGYAELVYDRSCGRFSDTGNWFVHGRSVPVEQTTIPPSPSPERPRYERDESEWSGSAETGDAAWQAADDAADVAEEMRRWEAEQLALGGITRPGADEEATNELA